ncbi:MAG: UDP-3-O-(3-hydroxymyristoyl)glucosamine N-acyltransferase [Desulfobacteraceae bacterium]|nr:UDP-3-O-(3-hydroxymyristoyl)glucosamine N-acyltransferase [Desulfobacteraceae bacterium]
MKRTVKDIANLLNAQVLGDEQFEITGVSSFEDAITHELAFAVDPKFLNNMDQTKAGALVVPDSFAMDDPNAVIPVLLKTNNPKLDFFRVVSLFHPDKKREAFTSSKASIGENFNAGKNVTIEANVFIGSNVTLGNNVYIMPNVFIGDDSLLGDNTVIKPNVTIMERTMIGKDVIVHSGTVIGSDGFGFARASDTHEKLIHTGFVKIGDQVEIGACNTIDRGTLGMTLIEKGTKTDNQVHIAHNVKIGENSLVVAQVGIAGSSTIGKNVILAGKAGISGHITIGDSAIVGPYAGVHSDVPANEIVSGIPHLPHKKWLKVVNTISRLPQMRKKLQLLEKKINDLENKK